MSHLFCGIYEFLLSWLGGQQFNHPILLKFLDMMSLAIINVLFNEEKLHLF